MLVEFNFTNGTGNFAENGFLHSTVYLYFILLLPLLVLFCLRKWLRCEGNMRALVDLR